MEEREREKEDIPHAEEPIRMYFHRPFGVGEALHVREDHEVIVGVVLKGMDSRLDAHKQKGKQTTK